MFNSAIMSTVKLLTNNYVASKHEQNLPEITKQWRKH